MYILGISALYHDSAAVIIHNDEIIAAAQEERFTRKKHDREFPKNAITYCMKEANISAKELFGVIFYDDPFLKMDRVCSNIAAIEYREQDTLPNLYNMGGWDCEGLIESYRMVATRNLWIHKEIERCIGCGNYKVYYSRHHLSHAASAFYPSPYNNAVIITIDGVGEWETLTIGIGNNEKIVIKEKIDYPHSLGLLYSAFTYYCGFKVNSGDYKFMGLAPYGKPIYYDIIKNNIIKVKEDGSFKLNLEYFDYYNGRTMINEGKFNNLFGGVRRNQESSITRREMNIAASLQKVLEEVIINIVAHAKKTIGQDCDNLVLAGGVALNCVANGKLWKSKIFKNIWVQPAAGDAGGALGAALLLYYNISGKKRTAYFEDSQKGSYLGSKYTSAEIISRVQKYGAVYYEVDSNDIFDKIAEFLDEGKVIGLFEGRMEFGPRALGNRSIIADPRSKEMQSKLNLKIKYRESFRPFAPSVLEEDCYNYFEFDAISPYMLFVANVKNDCQVPFDLEGLLIQYKDNLLPVVNSVRSNIPAVTHVDYSARIQTVCRKRNPFYYDVINAFKKRTGCSVIVNTSFNVRGEPIVCTPEEAYECFMRTEMDILVMENIVLYKAEQPAFVEEFDWRNNYELD